MDDLISRQAAIDALEDYTDSNTLDGYEDSRTLIEILKALPSAQPEPCDDPRADVYYLAEKIGIHRLYALVVELRGEPEPCEDAVSRKDVVKFLDDWMSALNANCHHQSMADLKIIKNDFENLPSAQPEPCEDAVSRHRLLNDLEELTTAWEKYPVMEEQIKGVETAIGYVKTIPSVTPKEQRWIPCSERLPEENDYKSCIECLDGAVWYFTENGTMGLGYYYKSTKEWSTTGDLKTDGKVIAWQPLPEPYREEGGRR